MTHPRSGFAQPQGRSCLLIGQLLEMPHENDLAVIFLQLGKDFLKPLALAWSMIFTPGTLNHAAPIILHPHSCRMAFACVLAATLLPGSDNALPISVTSPCR